MVNKHTSNWFLWLALALGALAFAGCQASTTDPTPVAAQQVTPPEPASTAIPTEPAVEPPGAEPLPTATAEATATAVINDQIEPVDQVTQEAESDQQPAPAGESGPANADVEFVKATLGADGSWRFDVTVRHPDTGWEDYADGWDVVTPDGLVLKANDNDPFTRLLLHPHENEPPFTRSQSGIVVPEGVTVLIVRAHDLVDGFGGREVHIDLLSDGGGDFEVIRE